MLCWCLFYAFTSIAQITASDRQQAIDSIITQLNNRYVFPETAKKIENMLVEAVKTRKYQNLTDGNAFANALTEDLRSTARDKHLAVFYSPEPITPNTSKDLLNNPEQESTAEGERLKLMNYGIRKVDVLRGNIGYLDFNFFCSPKFAGDTYAAMMNYVSHTNALIIDLRNCGGSMSADAIPFICSYFFEKPVHLVDLYWRQGDVTNQYWSYAHVSGKKYTDKPIYIVTGGATFSGAEELAYDLKNLKRATIIGETTGGGANGGGTINITDHFAINIPLGRAISPITKTNWEGVGVTPDVSVKSKMALHHAQILALQQIVKNAIDVATKENANAVLTALKADAPVFKKVSFTLKGFKDATTVAVAGNFNNWSAVSDLLIFEKGQWMITTDTDSNELSYKFVVDGKWILDPINKKTITDGQNINSFKRIK